MSSEIATEYLAQAEEILGELSVAVGNGEPESVYNLVHKLRGSSSMCGMTAIEESLAELDRMGKQADLRGAEASVCAAKEALGSIRSFLLENIRK